MDKRAKEFEWWHEAVFGAKPIRTRIPHEVLRAYLDYEWEETQKRKHGL